jgi:hypothetical protein
LAHRNHAGAVFVEAVFDGIDILVGQTGTTASGQPIALGGADNSRKAGLDGAQAWLGIWHDDVSDGPVATAFRLRDGRRLRYTIAVMLREAGQEGSSVADAWRSGRREWRSTIRPTRISNGRWKVLQ